MAKYIDCGYSFFMSPVTESEEDGTDIIGQEVDIEDHFPGLVYKSCTGLKSFGKTRPYEEKFAEDDKASVYISPDDPRDQTTITLTLFFFDAKEHDDDAEAIAAIDSVYRSFMTFISGCRIIYRDTARKRKVLLYLSDSTDPKTDRLYGIPYCEVDFKFQNVYGRSFGYDEELPASK